MSSKPSVPDLPITPASETKEERRERLKRVAQSKRKYLAEVKAWNSAHPEDLVSVDPRLKLTPEEIEAMSGQDKGDTGKQTQDNGGKSGNGSNSNKTEDASKNQSGSGGSQGGSGGFFRKTGGENLGKRSESSLVVCPDLSIFKPDLRPVSTAVVHPKILEEICADWKQAFGWSDDQARLCAVDIAKHCYHNGSSKETDLLYPLDFLKSVEEKVITIGDAVGYLHRYKKTLRQFCAYYAPLMYKIHKAADVPPAGWANRGATWEMRFLAFDTAEHIWNPAAMDCQLPRPTTEELQYIQTDKTVALRSSALSTALSTSAQVTQGHSGVAPRVKLDQIPRIQEA